MKKLLFYSIFCLFLSSCSVEELETDSADTPLPTLDSHARTPCADDLFVQVCASEINNPTVTGFRNFYKAQIILHTSLPTSGTFNPPMTELLNQYQMAQGIGDFSTNYTVSTSTCGEVTIEITAQVLENIVANAGNISNISGVCTSSQPIAINESLLSSDAIRGGKFSAASGVLNSQGFFDPSIGEGDYTITYTVNESVQCVLGEDSTSFTISVKQAREYNDVLVQLCSSAITNPTLQGFTNYYKNLVFLNSDQKSITGTFSPTMSELYNEYRQSSGLETYTTNYTFNTECGPVTMELAVDINSCP